MGARKLKFGQLSSQKLKKNQRATVQKVTNIWKKQKTYLGQIKTYKIFFFWKFKNLFWDMTKISLRIYKF